MEYKWNVNYGDQGDYDLCIRNIGSDEEKVEVFM